MHPCTNNSRSALIKQNRRPAVLHLSQHQRHMGVYILRSKGMRALHQCPRPVAFQRIKVRCTIQWPLLIPPIRHPVCLCVSTHSLFCYECDDLVTETVAPSLLSNLITYCGLTTTVAPLVLSRRPSGPARHVPFLSRTSRDNCFAHGQNGLINMGNTCFLSAVIQVCACGIVCRISQIDVHRRHCRTRCDSGIFSWRKCRQRPLYRFL
jgi:hypothetical protein